MTRDGFHDCLAIFVKDRQILNIIPADHPDRASKYVLMRDLAKLARIFEADLVMFIAEGWTAFGNDLPSSGFADESKNRGEAILLHAANSKGEQICYWAQVERKKNKPKRVASIGRTVIEEGRLIFMLYPFLKEWNCVDEELVKKSIASLKEIGFHDPLSQIDIPTRI